MPSQPFSTVTSDRLWERLTITRDTLNHLCKSAHIAELALFGSILRDDMEIQDAVLRRIMIIGEAAKRLSEDFRQQRSSVPWREIIGMHNIVTHDYDSVDLDEVWKVINIDLPKLLKYVQPLIDS